MVNELCGECATCSSELAGFPSFIDLFLGILKREKKKSGNYREDKKTLWYRKKEGKGKRKINIKNTEKKLKKKRMKKMCYVTCDM